MSNRITLLKGFILALLTLVTIQSGCIHDQIEHDVKIAGPEYAMYEEDANRLLQNYQNIRVVVDTSTLTNVTDAFRKYITTSLLPAAVNYIEATLSVPVKTAKLKAGGFSSLCKGDVNVPSFYNTDGVDADLLIFVKAKSDPSSTYVAMASACLLDTTNKRPIIGRITYNLASISASANDATREKDTVTTLHELTHVLGFSSDLYPLYLNQTSGQKLTGHYYTKTINGLPTTILNLPSLTDRLRNHFNCSTLEGAYIENQGGSGSAGSHFERRIFYNEYMTASTLIDTRVTEFSLALLEGTGWYQVNYNMAEPITWGRNKGCPFIQGPCVDPVTKVGAFPEFCSAVTTATCSWTKRAGSTCGAFSINTSPSLPAGLDWFKNKTVMNDAFGDNCPLRIPYNNLDCEDTSNTGSSTIAAESFGQGSKCFMGTLFPKGQLAKAFPYCFKSQCKLNQGTYYIQLKIGNVTVNCTEEKAISVTGFKGVLNCPNPQDFCSQIETEGICRRGCSGRGSCVSKTCRCVEGWSGFDCSKQVNLNRCSRCTDDPLRTTCFGDQCICNPSNNTCMCQLGLKTGSSCDLLTSGTSEDIDSITSETEFTEKVITKHTDNKENISSYMLATFLFGALGGAFSVGVIYLVARFAAKLKKGRKPDANHHEVKVGQNESIRMEEDTANSPQLSRREDRRPSTICHDSPLIHKGFRTSSTLLPSSFKKYVANQDKATDSQAIPETSNFVINLQPVTENQVQTPQSPVMIQNFEAALNEFNAQEVQLKIQSGSTPMNAKTVMTPANRVGMTPANRVGMTPANRAVMTPAHAKIINPAEDS